MQYSHRKKKKTEWDMGEYMPTNEQISARLWCIKNGISICVVPCSKYSGPKMILV